MAHQLADRGRADEAYGYFELALRLELMLRQPETVLQVRAVTVARSLAQAGQFPQACDLHRASVEQWGYPHDYQPQLYLYEKARSLASRPLQSMK